MYEAARANLENVLAAPFDFVSITLPEGWDGTRTVRIADDEGNEAQVTVHPAVLRAFQRAALLAPLGLCTRIDLEVTVENPRVVAVYWEG